MTRRDAASLYDAMGQLNLSIRLLVSSVVDLRATILDHTVMQRAGRPKLESVHDLVEAATGERGTPSTPPLRRWAERVSLRVNLWLLTLAVTAAVTGSAGWLIHAALVAVTHR
jgi:hypothetical protein